MPSLDINIQPTHNPKTIGIADASIYEVNFTINSPTVEITPPGFPKVAIPFIPRSVNILNSNNLFITEVVDESFLTILPDGIYKVKNSIQPAVSTYVEKNFIRIDAIKCLYSKIRLSLQLDECTNCSSSEFKKKEKILQRVRLLIEGSVASANIFDDLDAMKKYKQAQELLRSISNCEC